MPPPPSRKNPHDIPDSDFLPGQPLPAPHVVERDSDTAWAAFQALQDGTHDGRDGFPTTARDPFDAQPRPAPRAPVRKPMQALSEEEVMFEARRNNRVCPLPSHWQKLHQQLLALGADAPPPVAVSEWRTTASLNKRLALRQQVEWAAAQGGLEAVFDFLRALPEDKWHHMGE